MLKFEFTLTDDQAENLFSFLNDSKQDFLELSLSPSRSSIEKEWFQKHADYITSIKDTILAGQTRL